ncbi:MAG: dockerin type I domain-containing protein [Ruminococcus sp.]|nr:dockerin type I domain-containing protein [Ruminococcus sp.]
MNSLKKVLVGIVTLGVVSTMSSGVFASEIDDLLDIGISIGESNISDSLAESLQNYRNLLEQLETAEKDIDNIKEQLDAEKYNSTKWNELKDKLDEATKYIESIKQEIEDVKEIINNIKENNYNVEIGTSDITVGDSDKYNTHGHHSHNDFRESSWESSISSNFIFSSNKKFKDKKNSELKTQILDLMDTYSESEVYIADGTEEWWSESKHLLSVKITGEEEYEVKFNPIETDGELTSCYMYILASDGTITEGYFISADDYTSLKQSLSSAFLSDNVVAHRNNIEDFDEFVQYIEDTYKDQDDYFFDVDGNGKVASNDLLQNKKYLLGLSEDIGNYDSNNDGKDTSSDLLQLKKKLLGTL